MVLSIGVDVDIEHYGVGMPPKAIAVTGTTLEWISSRIRNPNIILEYDITIT